VSHPHIPAVQIPEQSACPASPGDTSRGERLREVARLFTRLGFTAFGGPAAHVAMMEDEVVHRRRWLSRQQFLDLVALLNFIPGPNSTELAIHLGLLRAGYPGLVVGGVCFILPAVLIILPLAWAYVRFGSLPQVLEGLAGVNAAVVAVLGAACYRYAKTALKDDFTSGVGVLAAAGAWVLRRNEVRQSELIVLAAAGLAGTVWHAATVGRATLMSLALPLPLTWFAQLLPVADGQPKARLGEVALFFLKVGATLFGSGYVLVTYLDTGLVEQRQWLTERQLLDSIAVGQVTPGPLLTTATFVGYLLGHRTYGGVGGGVAGAVVATACIFLPAFVLVALFAPLLPRLRRNAYAAAALDATNAAVAALVFVVTVELATAALRHPVSLAIAAASSLVLFVWNVNSTWVVLGGGAAAYAAWCMNLV